ncbi:hypothetical protein ACWDSD_12100 [Streptomyces spiralis]
MNHNTFSDNSGAGIVVGGVRPDAHHPSDPAMVNRDISITNNLVTRVAQDYKDMSGILSTYVTHIVIEHNEVSDLAYDGIDVGWGWGANDPGGSQDYKNRGLYDYQPAMPRKPVRQPTTAARCRWVRNFVRHSENRVSRMTEGCSPMSTP